MTTPTNIALTRLEELIVYEQSGFEPEADEYARYVQALADIKTIRNHIAALEQRAEAAEANARLLASSLQGAFAALDMEAPPAVQAAIDAARATP